MTHSAMVETRVRYNRKRGDCGAEVIFETYSDGREVFSDREFGEIRWYEYRPGEEELRRARRLRDTDQSEDSERQIEMNLDLPDT